MNFLLRNSSSQHLQEQQQQQQQQLDLSDAESDSQGSSSSELQISAAFESRQELSRLRIRVPLQGHTDVGSEGSLLIPGKELPSDWFSASGSDQLRTLDRGFVFPGEQINVLVTVKDLSEPESFTSSKVADKNLEAARSLHLLETLKNSHFYVRILGEEDREIIDESVLPVVMEQDGFDPITTGGMARSALKSCTLANGDVVVLLQLTVAAEASWEHALLEVVQYEQQKSPMSASKTISRDLDPAQDLLHWLLPLDKSSFLQPQPLNPAASAPAVSSAPQRLSFAASNSNIFSFGHLRSSSQGSMPQVTTNAAAAPAPPYPPSALNTAPADWNRLYPDKDFGSDVDGVLSFRGVPLEPQRFSVHCGLEGLYVPGRRWCRKISVVQPLAVTSYFADCNTDDLICVLIENVLPSYISDVIIYIDFINIICQTAGAGSHQQPVSIACIECGEKEKLPDLPLRTGEQHSFILRPTNTLLKADTTKKTHTGDSANYAVLISCHSSHTHSRFYVKHSLKWKPRPPRDLLVSVSLENSTPTVLNEALPQLKSQVVTVQTTNLTSEDLDLTLLAPSFLPHAPVSVESSSATTTIKHRLRNYQSFREDKNPHAVSEKPKFAARSFSLPPGREAAKESAQRKERPASPPKDAEDTKTCAAEASSARKTHLWLQSAVPLGRIPAHSTTVVKCDLLPLSDGIISLDSLHLATKDRGTLFFPENCLQIHSVSGIATVSAD